MSGALCLRRQPLGCLNSWLQLARYIGVGLMPGGPVGGLRLHLMEHFGAVGSGDPKIQTPHHDLLFLLKVL